jgi:hypothetical protein
MKSGTTGGTIVHEFLQNDSRNAERLIASIGAAFQRNGSRNEAPNRSAFRSTPLPRGGTMERAERQRSDLPGGSEA